jgi:hypothetical protein
MVYRIVDIQAIETEDPSMVAKVHLLTDTPYTFHLSLTIINQGNGLSLLFSYTGHLRRSGRPATAAAGAARDKISSGQVEGQVVKMYVTNMSGVW